jgi:hypothetical protein
LIKVNIFVAYHDLVAKNGYALLGILIGLVATNSFEVNPASSSSAIEQKTDDAEFQTTVNLSASGTDAQKARIATENSSEVYVVWMEDTRVGVNDTYAFSSYDIFFRASVDGGHSYRPKINLSNDTLPSLRPLIEASDRHVYVIWIGTEPGTNRDRLFFRVSHDNGMTFADTIEFTRQNESASQFDMAVTDDGRIYIVYDSSFEGHMQSLFRASYNYGGSFSEPVVYFQPDCVGLDISVDAAPSRSDNVYVTSGDTCAEEGGSEIFFRASNDGGKSFSPLVRIGLGQAQQMAVSSDRNVYITWQDDRGNVAIVVSRDAGATFGVPVILGDARDVANAIPSIVATEQSVYVIWYANVLRSLTPQEIRASGISNQTTEMSINTVLFFRGSIDQGTSFGSLKQLTSLNDYAYWAAVDARGSKVAIVWSNVSSTGSAGSQIFYIDSDNHGFSFNERQLVEQNTGDVLGFVQPQVAIAEHSEYATWWRGTFPESYEIYIVKKAG